MTEVTTSDIDQALTVGQQLPPQPTPSNNVETLLKGICERLDRTWVAEHTSEIAKTAANRLIKAANDQLRVYAADLSAKGLEELARQVTAMIVEVI